MTVSRNPGQSIRLILPDGREIVVTYVERRRLNVQAPVDVKILRGELEERAA